MIKTFQDLNTWKESHKLVLEIYKITSKFPSKETYILVSQILRAAISITSNIAEGFTRRGNAEKRQFYFTAKASLTEVLNQLIIAKDVGYISKEEFGNLEMQIDIVGRLLRGLILGIVKLNDSNALS
jgi:four helix bundle protein